MNMIDSKAIDKDLKDFRENGGSIIYTTKELLAHLDKKIDELDKKLDKHHECASKMKDKIGNNTTAIQGISESVKRIYSIVFGLFASIVSIAIAFIFGR